MRNYIRSRTRGGTYFFTVNLAERRNNDLLIRHIDIIRQAVAKTKRKHPFEIDGFVILPEHLHAIWTLPENDCDYSMRWRLIKSHFSRHIPKTEHISLSRQNKNERGIWQRRFWGHTIRDDKPAEGGWSVSDIHQLTKSEWWVITRNFFMPLWCVSIPLRRIRILTG